jgi:hypothetical protein
MAENVQLLISPIHRDMPAWIDHISLHGLEIVFFLYRMILSTTWAFNQRKILKAEPHAKTISS